MLRRLPVALVQVQVGKKSENLLNEISQIIYSLYQTKEITKKLYNNIMNSIKVQYKMGTVLIYLWILKIVKHLNRIDFYLILQIK